LAVYYLETSALVKLYVHEEGTKQLLRLTADEAENRFAIFSLSQVELRAAIRRRQRMREISPEAADSLLESFRQHSEQRFLVQPFSQSLLDIAFALLDGYALRAYDSMQLAGYLVLRSISGLDQPVFVCADKSLLSAAENEGCPVLDPCA
jgi:predicted nucleic acid-binding protein